MNTFSWPSAHDNWTRIADKLRAVCSYTPENITPEDLRDLVSYNYAEFNGSPSEVKFCDIPAMIHQLPREVVTQFLTKSLPLMCRCILDVSGRSDGVSGPPFFGRLRSRVETFSPQEAFTIISMCFLCIPLIERDGLPNLSNGTCHLFFTDRPRIVAKLYCLLTYFNLVAGALDQQLPPSLTHAIVSPERRIVIERIVAEKAHGAEWWLSNTTPLCTVTLKPLYERIESAVDALQADFANKHIGGGVLRRGCVQEEIRFMISPECLLAVLLCDPLGANEAVVIRGTIQFSDYSGYASSFKCRGVKKMLRDAVVDGTCRVQLDDIVCIDAIPFRAEASDQFTMGKIVRELEKCRIGLIGADGRPFATGNWGCGAFGGDTQLKAVIQWIACSASGRHMDYYPFDDEFTERLPELVSVAISGSDPTVGGIFRLLLKGLNGNELRESITIDFLLTELRATNNSMVS